MARDARPPPPRAIFHSDACSQNASTSHRIELASHSMLAFMSGKGNCFDNAVTESFFATLEFELLMTHD
jgi:putative transposase